MKRLRNALAARLRIFRDFQNWNYARRERRYQRRLQRQTAKNEGKLVVVGIMKNEAMVVQEWIQHYLDQGADRIILIDNGSTDESVQLAQSDEFEGKVTCVSRSEQWRQVPHYRYVIWRFKLIKKFQWLLIADLDEFWFCKDGMRVSDALPSNERIDLIYVRMSIFGSSQLDKQPDSVRESFIYRREELATYHETKWVCRLSSIKSPKQIGLHKVTGVPSERTISDEIKFQLNHYVVMSREYFQKVKMTRGDAIYVVAENMRDWDYFARVDKNCTVKDTLIQDAMRNLS